MITNIRTLRSSTKEILNAVHHGNTVILTNRGRPCAKIIPVLQKNSPTESSAFGMWKGHKETKDVKTYINKLRKNRHAH